MPMLSAIFLACMIIFSIFIPVNLTIGDAGGPTDSGDDTPEGLSIFNNSGAEWMLADGDDLRFADSLIIMEGNITLQTASNLTLVNSTLNITGWIDVMEGSRLELINSTISFNETGTAENYLRIDDASFHMAGPPGKEGTGYYSHLRTNNSQGFEFNASGSWINLSDSSIEDAGKDAPTNDHERGLYLSGCVVNLVHAAIGECRDGLVTASSNLTLVNSTIEGTHAVTGQGGSLYAVNTTLNTTSIELELAGMDVNLSGISFENENPADAEITGSTVKLNASEGSFKFVNSTYDPMTLSGSAVVSVVHFLSVSVFDEGDEPYSGAVLTIRNKKDEVIRNLTLQSGSATELEITSMGVNSTGAVHSNPLNITVWHPASISSNSTEIELNSTTVLSMTLPASEQRGNWDITDDLIITNKTIHVFGNINISSGSSLTLVNTTIQFEPTIDGQYMLYGNSNSTLRVLDLDDDPLTMDGSVLRSGTDKAYLVYLNMTKRFEMRNSMVRDCGYYSPVFPLARSGIFILNNDTSVTGSTFTDSHTGLVFINSRNANVTDNSFSNENGIVMINTHSSNISRNTFRSERNDIYVHIGLGIRIDNNTFLGEYDAGDANSTAVELWYAQNNTVHNNTIEGKGNTGISITLCANNDITSNTITDSHIGINVTRLSFNNVLASNDIAGVDVGINLNNSRSNTIESNHIQSVNRTGINAFSNRAHTYQFNTVNGTTVGVNLSGSSELIFHNNTITNATSLGLGVVNLKVGNITNNTLGQCNNRSVTILKANKLNFTYNYLLNESAHITNTSFHTLAHVAGRIELLNDTWVVREIFGNAYLVEKWYLHVHVMNSLGLPVPGATVTLYDLGDREVWKGRTLPNGTAMWFVAVNSIYESASTLEYRTPHTIRAEYGEHKIDATFYVNNSMTKNVTVDTKDIFVDWTIESGIIFRDIELNVLGNITIKNGGRLTLRNFTLRMHSPHNGARSIVVENGGHLYMYGGPDNMSVVTSSTEDSSHRYRFWIQSGGRLEMEDVNVRECGYRGTEEEIIAEPAMSGLFTESDRTTITDCLFESSYIGLIVNSTIKTSTSLLSSSIFRNVYGGILLLNSEVSIEDLMFMNLSGFGIKCVKRTSYTGLYLSDSVFSDIVGAGISSHGAYLDLDDCTMIDINGTAVLLEDNTSGEITGLQILRSTDGLVLTGSSVIHVQNSTIDAEDRNIRLAGASIIELVNTVPGRYSIDDNLSSIFSRFHVSVHCFDDHNPDGIRYEVGETTVRFEELLADLTPLSSNTWVSDGNGELHDVLVTHQEIFKSRTVVHYYNVTSTKSGYEGACNSSLVFNELNRRIDVFIKDISPPQADAGRDDEIMQGEQYEFDGSYTTDNVKVEKYTWSFLYGQNVFKLYGKYSEESNNHTFDIPGRYVVTLTAMDRNGNEGTDEMILDVKMRSFEDRLYVSKQGVSATLVFENEGRIPAPILNITMRSDDLVTQKPQKISTIGITFSISIQNLKAEKLRSIELGVYYGKRDISHITDESRLNIYIQGGSGTWMKFDSKSIVDTVGDRIEAEVTTPGNFTVMGPIDVDPPEITGRYPDDNARNVPLNASVTVSFSEPVTGVSRDTFVLLYQQNKLVDCAVESTGSEAVLTPVVDLEKETKYTILLKTDITDVYGNRLPESVTWSFTTVEREKPPVVSWTSPENGDTNVSVNTSEAVITIAFSKPMDLTSLENGITITPAIQYTIELMNMDRSVMITPTANLEYSRLYSVEVSVSVMDRMNLSLTAPYLFNFTTEAKPAEIPADDTDGEKDSFLDIVGGMTILVVLLIVALVIMVVLTFLRRFSPPSEEITEEIGEISSCPECGEAVDPADRICSSCGVKLKRQDFVVECPKCKTPLQPDDKKCPSCGFKHKHRERTVPLSRKAARKKKMEEEEVEKCPFCTAKIAKDADSCPVCGEVFEGDESDLICDKCGASIDPDEVLCPSCGEKFYEDEMVCSECGASIAPDDEMCPECGELFDEDFVLDIDEDEE